MPGEKQKGNNNSTVISFFVGAVVGAVASVVTYFVTTRNTNNEERQRVNLPPPPRPVPNPGDVLENQDEHECPVCLISFSDLNIGGYSIMALECGHVLCSQCLTDLRENSPDENFKCPACRIRTNRQSARRIYL